MEYAAWIATNPETADVFARVGELVMGAA